MGGRKKKGGERVKGRNIMDDTTTKKIVAEHLKEVRNEEWNKPDNKANTVSVDVDIEVEVDVGVDVDADVDEKKNDSLTDNDTKNDNGGVFDDIDDDNGIHLNSRTARIDDKNEDEEDETTTADSRKRKMIEIEDYNNMNIIEVIEHSDELELQRRALKLRRLKRLQHQQQHYPGQFDDSEDTVGTQTTISRHHPCFGNPHPSLNEDFNTISCMK